MHYPNLNGCNSRMIGYFIVLQNTVLQSIWNTLFKGDIADVKALTVKQM